MGKKALVESALFVSDKPLSVRKLSELTKIPDTEIKNLIEELKNDFQKSERGIELVETPEGYELRIKPEYRQNVSALAPFSDLTEGMLRTLAIVVSNQPVKQSVIVRYQGNKAYGYISGLEAKGLLKTEKFSRTKIVTTTADFEKYFGMSSEQIRKALEQKTGEKKQ